MHMPNILVIASWKTRDVHRCAVKAVHICVGVGISMKYAPMHDPTTRALWYVNTYLRVASTFSANHTALADSGARVVCYPGRIGPYRT
jgi:hypothetical protein